VSAEAATAETGPEIRFEDVHTRWSSTGSGEQEGSADRSEALTGLSLTLPAGGITVLLGDHQSGKSLLAMHLLGMVAPDSGRVMVSDQSVWDLPQDRREELKKRFGVLRGGPVMRETATNPEWSVLENIVRGLPETTSADRAEEVAHEFLGAFDLDQFAEQSPRDLNSAARRRLALATALVGDPKMVVIDDPGEALDSEHLNQMVNAIKTWQGRTRSTVLLCVRSLRVARELGDQVAVLNLGRVASHGTPDEVLEGVIDDDSFEGRFDTGLGGYAEADPERSQLGRRKDYVTANRRQRALVVVFLLMVLVVLYFMLFGGIRDRNALHGMADPSSVSTSTTF
jgi:ABC-type multidrug transport system ATPase subunit